LPYTITMSTVGLAMVLFSLRPSTDAMYEKHIINHHDLQSLCKSMQGEWKQDRCVMQTKQKSSGH